MKNMVTYKISTKDKDYTPENNKKFNTTYVKTGDIRDIVKNENYSLITWKGGERSIDNFESACGSTIDVDDGLTIPKAIERLQRRDLNYLVVTSKNHTKEKHRYHIIILFQYPVYNVKTYGKIVESLRKIFPESDKAVTDPARFIFGSPDDCEVHEYWSGTNYDTSKHNGLWDQNTLLFDKNDNVVNLTKKMEKTPIKCPFHYDKNPSAFVQYSNNNFFIHCSSCDNTFWMYQDQDEWLKTICTNFYSYGPDVWDFGIINEEFMFEKIGKTKFHILTNTHNSATNKKLTYEYLVKNKHIRKITRIDYLGDISIDESYYKYDPVNGVFEVHFKAIQPKISDNKFVEDYLEDRFGQYKQFIKEWLAMYCYTNFQPLPTLVFFGDRGGGKTIFSEIISKIFPSLSHNWSGEEKNFTYEKEKKFVIIEETSLNKISQYQTIKKYSGSPSLTTNKKFKDPYQVKNNMNICLLSNDRIPLFVKKDEIPKGTNNNQFFVYEFPPLNKKISKSTLENIVNRLGHYIRTELKEVYENLSKSDHLRYSIEVPITKYEKELFINNATETDHEISEVVNALQDIYIGEGKSEDLVAAEFLKKGFLVAKWLKDNYPKSSSLIKNMAREGLICADASRVKAGAYRQQAFKIKTKLQEKLNEAEEELPF